MDFVYHVLTGLQAFIAQETALPDDYEPGPIPSMEPAAILLGEKLLDDPEDVNPHVKIFHDREQGTQKADDYDEIGGTMGFAHHFIVECRAMFTRESYTREEAIQIAMDLFERVKNGILKHLDAAFGGDEEAFLMQRALRKYVYTEGGGPPTEWIWDARFEIEIVTQKP